MSSGLKVGMRLEMLSENQTPLFKGVISKKDDECIWVSHAEGSEVPPVVYNSRVRLKGYKKDDNHPHALRHGVRQARRCSGRSGRSRNSVFSTSGKITAIPSPS